MSNAEKDAQIKARRTFARDLDLNLLRVFVVAAEHRSVTEAASHLYLTQPAVSAALKRLADAVGAPLFARQGRGLVLTTRGERLLAEARPHLEALVGAALSPSTFDPAASDRTIRVGLSDSNEAWLLPRLVRALGREAPRMRLVVVPVQFRTVGQLLASGALDFAVTVADDLPAGIKRAPLFYGGFSCLFDPRHARIGKTLTRAHYLAQRHIVVSYNGDLRGIIEDLYGMTRDVAVSVPTFHSIGALVQGTPLLATIPTMVAQLILHRRPKLRTCALPFTVPMTPMEILWRGALDDDPALRFVMKRVERLARAMPPRMPSAPSS